MRERILLTVNGVSKTLPEWEEETGVQRSMIWRRLKLGWSPERAITKGDGRSTRTERRRKDNRMITCRGITKPLCEWSRELGILPFTIHARIKRGWSPERALTTPSVASPDYGGLTTKYPSESWIWQGMIRRCTNPNCKAYPDYGGRGIRVCKRWRNSFRKFLKDMGKRPSPKHEIDRIDNDGD